MSSIQDIPRFIDITYVLFSIINIQSYILQFDRFVIVDKIEVDGIIGIYNT